MTNKCDEDVQSNGLVGLVIILGILVQTNHASKTIQFHANTQRSVSPWNGTLFWLSLLSYDHLNILFEKWIVRGCAPIVRFALGER